ncbi:MAG: hypothetical protein ACOYEV_16695, partial [Candidatus Nanopelagicales bacterium]
RAAASRNSFINPYNFVPLPASPPERSQPPGHAIRQPGLLHGRIDFEFRALSPVLVRDSDKPADGGATALPRRAGRVTVPGSSFKGALRSAFEAVTGSCLRVSDYDSVPAYRDVSRSDNRAGWYLIEVTKVDGAHRPTEALICTDPVWFSFPVLKKVLGMQGVRTGARLKLLPGGTKRVGKDSAARDEARDTTKVAPVGSDSGKLYTILVTDVRARGKELGVCFVGAALPAEPTPLTVAPDAWARFEGALDGTSDMKRGEGSAARKDEVALKIDKLPPSVGSAYRQLQGVMTTKDGKPTPTPGLRKGHVLWAKTGRDETGRLVVLELAFAQTWRHRAGGDAANLRARLKLTAPGFAPCAGLDLCPACRVFGSARTDSGSSRSSGDAESPNYRGHLRFGPITVTGEATVVTLAPLGQPRPGSGQMYLQHDNVPTGRDARAETGAVPLREWGSALDRVGAPRPIRGRKFYWRTGPVACRPDRHLKHESQAGSDNSERMFQKVELISAGAVFTGSLTFENLSATDLAALLVSLDPARIAEHARPSRAHRTQADQARYCFTLGGGKPLGLGSLSVESVSVLCEDAADRYTGMSGPAATSGESWIDELAVAYPAAAATWPAFLELSCWNAVDPALVCYPRDVPWPVCDGPDLFKTGFGWWTNTAGLPWGGGGGKGDEREQELTYLVLPDAIADDVAMPIHPQGVAPAQKGGQRHGR